ncbi:hypothetical protein HDV04_000297 [Boothiomyces sp. JEL0838]|nr:hypothetical protein HDV04_000297 [Boothiomyces sp. JEL0838]
MQITNTVTNTNTILEVIDISRSLFSMELALIGLYVVYWKGSALILQKHKLKLISIGFGLPFLHFWINEHIIYLVAVLSINVFVVITCFGVARGLHSEGIGVSKTVLLKLFLYYSASCALLYLPLLIEYYFPSDYTTIILYVVDGIRGLITFTVVHFSLGTEFQFPFSSVQVCWQPERLSTTDNEFQETLLPQIIQVLSVHDVDTFK